MIADAPAPWFAAVLAMRRHPALSGPVARDRTGARAVRGVAHVPPARGGLISQALLAPHQVLTICQTHSRPVPSAHRHSSSIGEQTDKRYPSMNDARTISVRSRLCPALQGRWRRQQVGISGPQRPHRPVFHHGPAPARRTLRYDRPGPLNRPAFSERHNHAEPPREVDAGSHQPRFHL